MTRRALACVTPVLVLLAGGFGAGALATSHASPTLHQVTPTEREHSPAVTADAGANDALAVTADRISDDTGRSAGRLFSIALAALAALVALLAVRRTRPVVAFATYCDASLEARRRGPPLLRCA